MIFKLNVGECPDSVFFSKAAADETLKILKSIEVFQEQVRSGECGIENDTQQRMFDLDLHNVDVRAFRSGDQLYLEVV